MIDGCAALTLPLSYSRRRIAYSVADTLIHEKALYVGHAVTPQELNSMVGRWQLGPLMLFEGT